MQCILYWQITHKAILVRIHVQYSKYYHDTIIRQTEQNTHRYYV